ncbi:MAG: response regulator transcription factor [Bacteroidetes bacterium]|nr:response regulator transcription factor [Bacteroidota bacterium]
MTSILIVEDEMNMVIGLKDNFELEGFRVEVANNGEEGLKKILEGNFDLVVLDVMLPILSGFDVCKSVRKKGINTPIILLTARGEEIDRVLGLELGADDYVTKPFSIRELIARIKAVLRRVEKADEPSARDKFVNIGRLRINFATYNAFNKNVQVQMSHKEFEILNFLWNQRNKTASRDEILKIIWGFDESPTTRTVDNFIVKLRQKIEENSNNPKTILTVHGIGYKLIA